MTMPGLYLIARNGRRYLLRPENYTAPIGNRMTVRHTFEMEEITNTINTADGLRTAFGF